MLHLLGFRPVLVLLGVHLQVWQLLLQVPRGVVGVGNSLPKCCHFTAFLFFPSGIVLSSRTRICFWSLGSSVRSSSSSSSSLVDVETWNTKKFKLSRFSFLTCCSLKEIQILQKFIIDDEFTEVSLAWNSALKLGIEIWDLLVPCVNMKRGPVKICNSTWRVYIEYSRVLWVSIAELSLKKVFSWKSNPKWIFKEDLLYECGLCEIFSLMGLETFVFDPCGLISEVSTCKKSKKLSFKFKVVTDWKTLTYNETRHEDTGEVLDGS